MTLQQLEYVVALDTYRHFVEAANHTHVTQPTLTMQVKKLEDEIGFRLFDRSKKPIEPTPAGEVVIAKARRILREIKELKAYVNDEQDSLEGVFNVAIIPTLAPYLLPKFLPQFVASHKKTRLVIHEMQTDRIIERLKDGSIDIGILVTSLGEKDIREVPMFNEPFVLYHPKSHPVYGADKIKSSELETSGLMVLNEGHCFRDQTLAICNSKEIKNDIGFDYQSGSIEGLMQMVRKGIGYTLVPEMAVEYGDHSDYITRFQSPQPVREVSLVTHQGFTREAVLELLRDSIRASVPKEWLSTGNFYRVKWR